MSRIYSNWITQYIEYTANSEAPPRFHYWTAVSSIAGALRRRVYFNMGRFRWYPNFFIFFVAPPGIVQKSTTADVGMEMLQEIDGINIGPASTSWQALVKALSECQEEYPLGDGNYQPMSAMTIVASELGTFLDPRNREMIDVLVALWDGKEGAWKKLTKMDGEELVINPWINLIGCTTPAWVAENFNAYFTGGGFASRSVLVFADEKYRLEPYPFLTMMEGSDEVKIRLINDLTEISKMQGEYKLSKAAIDWGIEWYTEHYTKGHDHLEGEKFKGYLARKQTQIHKTGMVLAAAASDSLIITKDHLKEAYNQLTELETYMPKVFGLSNKEALVDVTEDVLTKLKQKGGRLSKRKLYREFHTTLMYETYDKVLASLVNSGRVNMGTEGNTMMLWID